MTEAAISGATERMGWDQICAKYRGSWVLLVDVDYLDEVSFEPRSAVVVAHSEHRRETLVRAETLPKPIDFAHFFIPKPGYRE